MSNTFQHPEGFVITETSNLLEKSLSNKSLASHEELQKDLEVQLESIRKNERDAKSLSLLKKNIFLGFLGALLTVLILGGVTRSAWSDDERPTINAIPGADDSSPLSLLDPVRHLKMNEHGRPREDPSFPAYYYGSDESHPKHKKDFRALPTNAWYQNMLQAPQRGEPSNLQRIYPGPYLLDVSGIIPGLRIHGTDTVASDMVMQLSFLERHSLILGATSSITSNNNEESSNRYNVLETTDLGVTLEWEAAKMAASIVRGMSFITMEYDKTTLSSSDSLFPTIAAPTGLERNVVVDGKKKVLDCSKELRVENDMEFYVPESDYSWMAFFSEPVWIRCSIDNDESIIQVVKTVGGCSSDSDTLMIRVALIDQCTKGNNAMSCRKGLGNRLQDEPKREEYVSLLRAHADAYPGRDTSFSYVIPEEEANNKAELIFDWDVKYMSDLCHSDPSKHDIDLLVFAIPHQMERLPSNALPNDKRYCKASLTGPACLLQGNIWVIPQDLPEVGFRAKRPPKPEYIPTLGEVLSTDIEFDLPDYYKKGAGDTYFSGKILAKLARIILVAEEVESICGEEGGRDYVDVCQNATLPSQKQKDDAVQRLREGVEIWINGKAETPLVYDTSWGGVVSCGCYMERKTKECINRYPDCPAFYDPGLNFGNGYYNDHHFHYGYHIFAAAVAAHYDHVWAMDNFENVLLMVRDIANPSEEDKFFPQFRHKDWYQGSSWASGVPYPAYLNGNNQESSSEAIAAYESVALFGQVMNRIWQDAGQERYAATSKQIYNVGRLLTGTELTSTKRYWQIPDDDANNVERIYPEQYNRNVVGIMWQTMAQFGTWFGSAAYLPIGIQLLPITPISEERDGINWMNSIYEPFTKSCANNFDCTESGWSILQLSILATVGYPSEAAQKMKELPDQAFENAGGNGHSRSNTLWYIATRPNIENPVPMVRYDKRGKEEVRPKAEYELKDCYQPDTCTEEVLDRYAGAYTCGDRISWMIDFQGLPQWQACRRVAGLEFPNQCGGCNPSTVYSNELEQTSTIEYDPNECPPCTDNECNSDLNRCPVYERTFVCTQGANKGGCSGDSMLWTRDDHLCHACCEMTNCFGLKDHEAKKFTKDGNALTKQTCPPCQPEVCYGKLNLCPIHSAPYLCTDGRNSGGCSPTPWKTYDGLCNECCEIQPDC